MNKLYKVFTVVSLMTATIAIQAQNVGIGTNAPDPSAKLHVVDANRGVLISKVSIGNVAAAAPVTAPATGLLVFNTNAATTGGGGTGFYYWDGAQWVMLSISSGTDDQNLTSAVLVGNNLTINIENGASTTVDLSTLVNDADNVIGNEYNTNMVLLGTNLSVIDGGGSRTVDLSPLRRNAANGLHINSPANAVYLGGPLIENTTITQEAFGMTYNLNGTGDFRVQDNGANRFIVLDNGRVEMNGTTDASGTGNTGVLEIADALRIDGNEIITNTATTLYLQNDNDGDLRVDASTLVVDASLNRVGVGTIAPSQKLHVVGGARITSLGGVGNALVLTDNTGVLTRTALSGNGTDVYTGAGTFVPASSLADNDWTVVGATMYNNNTGNVGVGITTPAEKFHVVGDLRVSTGEINSASDNLRLMQGVRANDSAYEWTGWYSGTTRQGIILYDGAWSGANSLTNEFSLSAENGNHLSLNTQGNQNIFLMPKGTGKVGVKTIAPTEELTVNGWIGRTAHNNGALCGSYNSVGANSAQSNPIYIIGSNYKPATTTLGNMYGTGYTHTNASFIGNTTSSWGQYIAADGDARIWFGASSNGHSYFNTGGRLGINTTLPNATLDCRGSAIFNENSGNNDFRIESDGRTHALWLDASTNIVNFGDVTATATDNGGTIAGSTVQYVADFDLGGAIWDGTAIGIGSIEYLLDGVATTLINNGFGPTTHITEDLGTAARAWDDIYGDDFWNVSDAREKSEIKDLSYGLKEVMAMRPVSYKLNKDQFGETKLGLLAQDALKIVPESVKTHDHKVLDESKPKEYTKVELERMAMSYTSLIPVLIKATQEQQAQIEALKAEIKELKEAKK